jgi:hypothetical protein
VKRLIRSRLIIMQKDAEMDKIQTRFLLDTLQSEDIANKAVGFVTVKFW